jgi:small-conductance mechanosensitive channel
MRTVTIQKNIKPFPSVALCSCLLLGVVATGVAVSSAGPQDVIDFLNQTIVWYRQLSTQQSLASQPIDVIFLNDNRQLADQIAQLSFEFARARAQALATDNQGEEGSNQTAGSAPSRFQSLLQLAKGADQLVKQRQAEIDSFKSQLAAARGRKRQTLESTIAETQSELDLASARRDAVQSMLQFAGGSGAAHGGSLLAQVDELARTIPATNPTKSSPVEGSQTRAAPAAVTAPSLPNERSGVFGLISQLFDSRRKMQAIDEATESTNSLAETSKAMRTPLVADMKGLIREGDELTNQSDSQDPVVLAQQKKQLDALTARFKKLSASVLPLAKQSILLDLYQRNLANWHSAAAAQYSSELKNLLWRLGGLLAILAVVFFFSELWRRATFRYIQDARRRYQFMLLRRIVLWFLVAVIITVTFASELGSLATFAGLLTAGVAVALQNVILSVAGYFFLIGKYGVRVGDRVQIAGVTGDVIDIGLVRLHLMELGEGARPTGRVVVFSNAIVFQANAGLFKPVPGTKFVWHEITLTLPPQSDYHQVENRMLKAVKTVFADYKDRMQLEHLKMQHALTGLPVHDLDPESRLKLTPTGVEVVIRYPVELDQASEIDDRIARTVMDATDSEAKVKVTGSGSSEDLKAQPAK